ncbi:MAG: dynamin family protein [Desulfobacteraceae bacterium]|nr:dynamin family protein [Desulfobacteraceae bacterium]
MMTNKIIPSNSIDKIISDTQTILQQIKEIGQISDRSFAAYQTICQSIPVQIQSGRLKIAVVGVIKSGKSTFINSIVGKELVKRGAGVITSITTRIRKSKKNQANLYFKSWDDINLQLRKALMLFPDEKSDNPSGMQLIDNFDIRRKKDRAYLKKAYQTLITQFSFIEGEIRPETLLIKHALDGFDCCKDFVQADEATIRFESRDFDKHKAFTSDPTKAFYIKDVCLNVFGKIINPNIEIADCQGADSTDPSQLAHVLDYLESSNLIIYIISSRTGLRQSDVTFLKQIKNLGLIDNILFINNCDLSEHENLDDLVKIETHIKDDLGFLEITPQIFSFSSLYDLFLKLESKLTKRDLSRLKLWQEEKKMVQYCDSKTKEFNDLFNQTINKNQYELLISNHLKRLGLLIGQLDHRIDIFLDLLSNDRIKEQEAVKTIDNLQQNASRLESIVANSIDGAVSGLRDEINLTINEAFALDQSSILKKTHQYIETASIDVEKYKSIAKESGFNQIIYLMFQDFKRMLDLYVIKEVKPKLSRFIQDKETRIASYFQSLFDSYQIDLLKADEYSKFDEKLIKLKNEYIDSIDLDNIKKILGLQAPSVIFEAKYSSRIKANVFTDFSLQTVSQIISSLLNKTSQFSFSPGLKKAAVKIKKENQKIIKGQFERYYANLQETYFSPLIDAAARDFTEKINEQFDGYHSIKKDIDHIFILKQVEKKDQKKKILLIKKKIQGVSDNIESASKISSR